jgi:hypothetical protein
LAATCWSDDLSSHDITVAGYVLILFAGVGLEWLARRGSGRIPTFSDVLLRAARTRAGRVGVIAGWAWLGLHFFAR